jgi:signal transduction histidine kinase
MNGNKPVKHPLIEEEKAEKKLRVEIASLYKANQTLREEIARRQQEEWALQHSEEEIQLLMNYANEAAFFIQEVGNELQENRTIGLNKLTLIRAFIHDLKGPLTLISSCAQFCMESSDVNPPMKENIRIIYESSLRANTLIKKFFKLFESPKILLKPVQINDLIVRLWKMVQLDTQAPQISFNADLEEELPEVLGNAQGLERVFYNLFLNAIQAVCKSGNVFVQTRFLPEEKMVEAQVMDDGPGIPPEYISRIFDPFFTTKEEGNGLGLAICLSIIQQHMGTIQVETAQKGAKISVKLPAIDRNSGQ